MSKKHSKGTTIVMWAQIGTGLGAAFGAASGHVVMCLALGVAIGASIGARRAGGQRITAITRRPNDLTFCRKKWGENAEAMDGDFSRVEIRSSFQTLLRVCSVKLRPGLDLVACHF